VVRSASEYEREREGSAGDTITGTIPGIIRGEGHKSDFKLDLVYIYFYDTPEVTGPEVPGLIPGATRFSEKFWVWNGVHSTS
jgi:hypothetical protein